MPVLWRLASTPVSSPSGSRYAPRLIVTSPLRRCEGTPSFTAVVNSRALSISVRSPSGKFIAIPVTFAEKAPRISGVNWTCPEPLNMPPFTVPLSAVMNAFPRASTAVALRSLARIRRLSKAKLAVGYLDVATDCRLGDGPSSRQARLNLTRSADAADAEKRREQPGIELPFARIAAC